MTEAIQGNWLDAIPAAVFLIQDRRVVFANRAAADLIGCPQGELAGVAVDDLLDDAAALDTEHSHAHLKGRAGSLPVALTTSAIEHESQPAQLVTALQRDPSELYHDAIEGSLDSFYLVKVQRDADGVVVGVVVVDASERGVQQAQLTRDRLIGLSITDLYPNLPPSALIEGFAQAFNTRQPYNSELFLADRVVKDGWYHVQLIPLEDDHIAVFLRDISERKESESMVQRLASEVEQQARLLDEVLSATPDAFILFDRAGHYLYTNRKGLELSGLTAAQVTGKTWRELGFPEETGLIFEQRLAHVFASGESITYEEQFPTLTGLRDFLTTLTPIHDKDGNVIFMLNTIHDITERKQAELEQQKLAAELEQQMRVFDEVLSTTPDTFLMFDRENRFVYASPSALRNTDLKPKLVVGKTWRELGFPQENGEQADEKVRQVFATGETVLFEESFPTVQGLRQFESIFSPLHDKDGQVVAVVITNRDITERKQIEEALRESEKLLSSIYQTALAGIAVVDVEGNYVQVNHTYAAIYGYTPAEMIGKNFTMILPPDQYKRGRISHTRVLAGETSDYVGEWRVVRRDGQEVEVVSYNNLLIRENGERFRVAVVLDVTAQKQAQGALEASEKRLTSILNSMEDGVWSVQVEKRQLLYANSAVETITGYSTADFNAAPNLLLDIVHPDDQQRFIDQVNQALAHERIDTEYRILRRDGETRWVHNRFWLASEQRIDGIMSDVTDRRHVAQQTMQLAIERERVRILSNFVRDASHEFRTPLSVINTRLYLLEKVSDPRRQAEYIEGIKEQAERILKLVESLITMSRLDSLTRLHFERIDINRVLSAITVNAEAAAARSGIAFTRDLSHETLYMQGDLNELTTAFNAIFDNALSYTARDGQIDLRTYRLNDREIAVDVRDTGVGISGAELTHIFERFYRVDTARSVRGFGLGLPIARKIVEMHHGRIEVESKLGVGSVFRLVFPADKLPRDLRNPPSVP